MGLAPDILVVDDESAIRLLLAGVMEDEGFSVRVAHDGHEALTQCEMQLPDLMILDLNMPRMDGFAVLAALDEREWRRFPVVVVSARNDAGRRLSEAVEGVVPKPVDLDELVMRVHRLLRPKNALRAPEARSVTIQEQRSE